jgi:hypothetical protein
MKNNNKADWYEQTSQAYGETRNNKKINQKQNYTNSKTKGALNKSCNQQGIPHFSNS